MLSFQQKICAVLAIFIGLANCHNIWRFLMISYAVYYLLICVLYRSFKVATILVLPRRTCSRVAGKLFGIEIPVGARPFVYGLWIKLFNVQIADFDTPLENFTSLREFFNRRILVERRQPSSHSDPNIIYAPADSKFTVLENFTTLANCKVKGVKFTFKQLTHSEQPQEKKVCFAVYYLSPGDFHDFMSFNNFKAEKAQLINGDFLPVNDLFMSKYNGCLAANERIVIEGTFGGRKAWYIAVAALNVGDIVIYNSALRSHSRGTEEYHMKTYNNGEGIGQFRLGSTVVICFELDEDETVEAIKWGKVQYGEPTVRIIKNRQE